MSEENKILISQELKTSLERSLVSIQEITAKISEIRVSVELAAFRLNQLEQALAMFKDFENGGTT